MQDARETRIMKVTALALISALVFLASALPCYADSSIYRQSFNMINPDEYQYNAEDNRLYIYRKSNVPTGTYSFSQNLNNRYNVQVRVNGEYIHNSTSSPIEVTEDINSFDIYYYDVTSQDMAQEIIRTAKPMLNEGSESLPYEPYWKGYKIVYGVINLRELVYRIYNVPCIVMKYVQLSRYAVE